MNIIQDSYISFLNLDHRTDRKQHMENQLARLEINAIRQQGLNPEFYMNEVYRERIQGMIKRGTEGAIGCHFGQVAIMENAKRKNKHAWVMEDDLIFCSDFLERIPIFEKFLDTHRWDIFWFGATFHANNPAWWHKRGHSHEMQQCHCMLEKDCERTDDFRFVRTYGCFCTYCYLVNKDSIEKILFFLDKNVHMSMGIDWLMILMQPHIDSFAFVPGSVKQMDSISDIGTGITKFSLFSKLGNYWYQDSMNNFDYNYFKI